MDTESCLANNLPTSFVSVDFEYIPQEKDESCKGKQYKAVWAIGMVKYIEGQICDKYYSLVCPPKECLQTPNVKQFNNLNPELKIDEFIDKIECEKRFDELFPEIENFINGLPLVAYSSATEHYCFKRLLIKYNLSTTIDYNRIHDSKVLSEQVEKALEYDYKGKGSYELKNVCERNSIEVLDSHNALNDAIMCGDLFIEMSRLARQNCLNVTAFRESRTVLGQKSESTYSGKNKFNDEDLRPRKDLDNIPENVFKNKNIFLTDIPYGETSQYGHQLWNLGAKVKNSFGKSIDILIVGSASRSKKPEEARKRGIQIMLENEMLEILNHFEDGM